MTDRDLREGDLGPQFSGDGPFTARMRFHQSWYRSTVLRAPCGTGPQASSRSFYGNMLDGPSGAAGLNFLSPQIYAVARERISQGGGVERFRCLHNMLSSQPMCFNLLGPLVGDLDLATRCMRVMLPSEVDRVTEVRIEYAPAPAHEYLGDRTSFDAFVAYLRPDGEAAFLGIETKLSEPFSPVEYQKHSYALADRARRFPVASRRVADDVALGMESAVAQPPPGRCALPALALATRQARPLGLGPPSG